MKERKLLYSTFKKNKLYLYGILFFIFLIILNGVYYVSQNSSSISNITEKLEETLIVKENEADNVLEKLSDNYQIEKNKNKINNSDILKSFPSKEISYFIFENKKLNFWSENSAPINTIQFDSLYISSFRFIKNGWYDIRKRKEENNLFVGLIPIKHEYPYQNEYLQNNFTKSFSIANDFQIYTKKAKYNIYSKENKYLFSINNNEISLKKHQILILSFLFLATLILGLHFLLQIYKTIAWFKNKTYILLLFFTTNIIVVRVIFFYFTFPDFLYLSEYFSPKYYASSEWLPSLGDLFINSILFLYIAYVLFQNIRDSKKYQNIKIPLRWFLAVCIIILSVTGFDLLNSLFNSIVINSDIPLNLNLIYNINEFSIIALSIMVFLLLGYYFIFYRFVKIAIKLSRKEILLLAIPFGIIQGLLNNSVNIFVYLFLLYILFVWILFSRNQILFVKGRHHAVFIILFSSLFTTISIYSSNSHKEKEKRKILAIQLTKEHDPIAEFLFKDVLRKSETDNILIKLVSQYPFSENHIITYLENNYFNGFWSKYRIQITICKPHQYLSVQPLNENINCSAYFSDKIDRLGTPTLTENLYFISYRAGSNSYLADLEVPSLDTLDTLNTHVFVEMDPKTSMKELGYPELLIDKEVKLNNDISNYSYALFDSGQLIKNYGKYYYFTQLNSYTKYRNGFFFYNENGYNHLYFNINQRQDVIISKIQDGFVDLMASFSYLLLYFVIFFILFYIIFQLPFQKWKLDFNFKSRLQLSMLGIILASFIVIGLLVMFYILKVNDNKNQEELTEKMHSILIEIEGKFASFDTLNVDAKPFMNAELNKLSNVFFTDINLFDTKGELFATSRPKVFEEGLISTLMNPEAVKQLINNQKAICIQEENIGSLKYMSAYIPFRNDRNQLLAYLNLPYFAREGDMKKEISTFMVAFINLYVLLLAIAIIIAVVVSSYITRPLQTIRNKIGLLSFGKANEKIKWRKNDEIGGLISEYNRMIDELSLSAELLAKSERESAWREMAKQVAHEIKNPLTPIKLSVQYLQKAWNDKASDFDDRLKKFTQTLVEQIDSLSSIATAFSDFAIMPQSKLELVNINSVLTNAIEIYSDKQNVELGFENVTHAECPTLADKQQLLRVFNNVLKNAFQAVEEVRNGQIEVKLYLDNEHYIVSITDNGKGISEEQKEKIFVPNFTTKNYGMGLGLAMTKNIIQSFNGNIWFESVSGNRTTFYISLLRNSEIYETKTV
ncbi:MAG: ATP-binding protein [Bacteroidota bacterium]